MLRQETLDKLSIKILSRSKELRKKLEKLMSPEEEVEDAVVIEGESFDADKELGLEEKSDDS